MHVQLFQHALVKESHYFFQLAQHTACRFLPWYATVKVAVVAQLQMCQHDQPSLNVTVCTADVIFSQQAGNCKHHAFQLDLCSPVNHVHCFADTKLDARDTPNDHARKPASRLSRYTQTDSALMSRV